MKTLKLNQKILLFVGLLVKENDDFKTRIGSLFINVFALLLVFLFAYVPTINFILTCDEIEYLAYVALQMVCFTCMSCSYVSVQFKKKEITRVFSMIQSIRNECKFKCFISIG